MRIAVIKVILASMILAVAGSCSLYENHEANNPANVMEVEARLVKAGFRRIPIDTPQENGAVAQLPMHRLNRYQSAARQRLLVCGSHYLSLLVRRRSDILSDLCGLLQQEHDTAEYVNDVQPEQVAGLSPFGYAFPPPLLLGGWPVMIPGAGSGPIRSAGGPGGGVFSHPGHGGGGHGGIGGHGGGHGGH